MNELRVAIIGCGKIADQHAQQIQRVRGSRLFGVCDSEKLMADQLAGIPYLFRLSRATVRNIKINLVISLALKAA